MLLQQHIEEERRAEQQWYEQQHDEELGWQMNDQWIIQRLNFDQEVVQQQINDGHRDNFQERLLRSI